MVLILATVALSVLLLVSASVAAVWWRQERIVYQPPLETPRACSDVQRVDYVAEDGQPLYGYVAEPEHAPTGLLIAFHGNADLAAWQIPWGKEVARRTGWRVLLTEYRGYGGAGGVPDYQGVRRDARAAWRFAREHLASSTRSFALFGHSLGSAVATELADEIRAAIPTDVANRSNGGDGLAVSTHQDGTLAPADDSLVALLLQSPFTSARDMARIVSTHPVQLLWKVIARVHYDTRSRILELDTPVSIAHGGRDWLIPVSMGRELFAAARIPGRLLVVLGASHNDVDDVGGDEYWRWMAEALTVRRDPLPVSQARLRLRIETSG